MTIVTKLAIVITNLRLMLIGPKGFAGAFNVKIEDGFGLLCGVEPVKSVTTSAFALENIIALGLSFHLSLAPVDWPLCLPAVDYFERFQ